MAFGDFTVTRASTKNILGSAGLYVSVANNTPAFEFNTDGTYRGLLVEPGATNQITNNSMTGAVAGSPGTLPTGWNELTTGGLSREVIATGTENGVQYIDLRYSGTASGTSLTLRVNGTTTTSTSAGAVWTNSTWLKNVATPTPYVSLQIGVIELLAGAFNTTDYGTVVPTTTLTRFSHTATIGGSNDGVRPQWVFTLVNGNTYNFTIRIGWPQLETGSVATSPIVTTAGTASRVADVVSLTGASSLIGATEGTLYAEVEYRNFTALVSRRILSLRADANTSLNMVANTTAGQIEFSVVSGGLFQAQIIQAGVASSVVKLAGAYKVDDFAFYYNGAQVGTDVSGTVPDVTSATIGLGVRSDGLTDSQFNGWIRSVALFPTRLSNAQLVTLTT
jgi:hypothetical protein